MFKKEYFRMEIINNKYRILEKIGEGSFGCIYKCENIRTNKYFAVKVEPFVNGTKLLKNETIIYHYLNNSEGIPTVKWFGKDKSNYYMVIDLLGESLQTMKNNYTKFSLKLVLQIGIKVVTLLKTIHEKGLIHRDIKPENFLLGLSNNKKSIYIIDFGFCKSYMINGSHISETSSHNLIGSLTYASINAHNLICMTRRDDLESLGYMLIYFYLGELPWQTETNSEKVKHFKIGVIENSVLPPILINYMDYVRKLSFTETPNYEYIIKKFSFDIQNM
jgi:serine/threonine protein kinase